MIYINTKKYLDFQFIGKIFISLLILLSFNYNSSQKETIKSKLKINYIKSERAGINNKYHFGLFFSIENVSNDTLYLSENHLSVICKNKKHILKNKPLIYEPLPFIMPEIVSEEEKKISKLKKSQDSIKEVFALKIFNYNKKNNPDLTNNVDKEYIIDLIKNQTIVLFPYESYTYISSINNKKFNAQTKVILEYNPIKTFTFFYTDNNKIIPIYWQ